MIEIFDLNDPRIKPFLNLRLKKKSDLGKMNFIADSNKTVIRLLKSEINVFKLLITEDFYKENYKLINSKVSVINDVMMASKSIMKEIIGYKLHGGVMALAEIPPQTTIDSLDSKIVIMNNIIDAENVGSIIRNSAAFNIKSIIVDNKTPHPYLRRVVRVSLGNIFKMKYYISSNLLQDLQKLRVQGYRIISIENNVKSECYLNFKGDEKSAIIFGNEGTGIDREILEDSDEIFHIPMKEEAQSINVSAASAIILNHIFNKNEQN